MRVLLDDIGMGSSAALRAMGVPEDDAGIVVDSILYAHSHNKHTHGIGRLSIYARKIDEGLMNPMTPLTILASTGAVKLLDAENGFGQVAGIRGMDAAIEMAHSFGIGLVGIRNSNNFGTAGFIGNHAAIQDMIGIVLANSGPAIAPTGGGTAILGTNPICVAFPSDGRNPPIILDMACSNVARGKIRLAAKNGEAIPLGWAVDENGKETEDPEAALRGSMMPLGGYKGFGLALCIDLLAGMLTGSAFGGQARNLNHPTEISRYGHLIIAIDPTAFLSPECYREWLAQAIQSVKACGPEGAVVMPGERSWRYAQSNGSTIDLSEQLVAEFNQLACSLNTGMKLLERK